MIKISNYSKKIIILLVSICFIFNSNALASSLDNLKPSMSFDIEKEAIKNYADIHGWQKTRSKISNKYVKLYEDDTSIAKWIRGTLWSPSFVWVDNMYEADLYFEDEETAEAKYRNFKNNVLANNEIQITLRLSNIDKEKIQLENLTFILDANDKRYRGIENADIFSRGIESQSAFGITAFSNVIDLYFHLDDLNIESLSELTLYTILDKSRERIELAWDLYPHENKVDKNEKNDETEGIKPGELIKQSPLPVYPIDLVGEAETGRVLVEANISEEGEVQSVYVIESSGIDTMDTNAKSTIERGWVFGSYYNPYQMIIEVIFDVDERDNPVIDVDLIDLIIKE